MKKIILIVSGVLLLNAYVVGQDFRVVADKIRAVYESADKLHVVMKVEAYDGDDEKPFYQDRVEVKRDRSNYAYRFNAMEMLMNDRFIIVVDEQQKEIVCTSRDMSAEQALAKDPVAVSMDSVLKLFDKPVFIASDGGVHHYRITPLQGELEQVDLFVDAEHALLRKIAYQYTHDQRASVVFETLTTSPVFSADEFNERSYVEVVGKDIRPSKALMGYHVVNVESEN